MLWIKSKLNYRSILLYVYASIRSDFYESVLVVGRLCGRKPDVNMAVCNYSRPKRCLKSYFVAERG